MSEITRQDIRDLKDELVAQMADGFGRNDRAQEQINTHLATLNGRVGKGENERGTISVRLATVERIVFGVAWLVVVGVVGAVLKMVLAS